MSPAAASSTSMRSRPPKPYSCVRIHTRDAAADAADSEHADIRVVIQAGHLQLKRTGLVDVGCRHVFYDGVEQGHNVTAADVRLRAGKSKQRRGIYHGKVELMLAGPQTIEQLERLIENPVGARAVAIDFVDDDQRREPARERFLRDETRLRHRTVHRIDEQEYAVDHGQDPFDLAAEVGVSRRIHDIDAPAFPADRRILGQDRDAALAFQIIRVHYPLRHDRPFTQGVGLLQQSIDQRGFAVIDVRDDRNVANVVGGKHGRSDRKSGALYRHSPYPVGHSCPSLPGRSGPGTGARGKCGPVGSTVRYTGP